MSVNLLSLIMMIWKIYQPGRQYWR